MKVDFDAIKRTTDIVRVIEGYGVKLKKSGADHVGLCPFHEDKKPSLHVTASKGLFHCPACGAAGNVIQFVARKEGVTDREAGLKLLATVPGVTTASTLATPRSEPRTVDPGLHPELFHSLIDYYHKCLTGRGRPGLDYLKSRGLGNLEMLTHFKVGYVDGGVKKKLSAAQVRAAQAIGLLNEKGNERYYRRVVVPIYGENNQPAGLYGRDITGKSEAAHLYLAGEHRAVWNAAAAAVYPDELIVTESILDALSIFAAGKKNVIACYGANGWTPHHDALIEKHSVRKIVFALDNDETGERVTHELAVKLDAKGIRCHHIKWPESEPDGRIKDANDYFQYHTETGFKGTPESFASLLAVAPRLGFIKGSSRASGPGRTGDNAARLTLAEQTDEHAVFENGSVSYRVKHLSNSGALKIVLTARKENTQHVDHLDLYGAKARKMFAGVAASRLAVEAEKVEARRAYAAGVS